MRDAADAHRAVAGAVTHVKAPQSGSPSSHGTAIYLGSQNTDHFFATCFHVVHSQPSVQLYGYDAGGLERTIAEDKQIDTYLYPQFDLAILRAKVQSLPETLQMQPVLRVLNGKPLDRAIKDSFDTVKEKNLFLFSGNEAVARHGFICGYPGRAPRLMFSESARLWGRQSSKEIGLVRADAAGFDVGFGSRFTAHGGMSGGLVVDAATRRFVGMHLGIDTREGAAVFLPADIVLDGLLATFNSINQLTPLNKSPKREAPLPYEASVAAQFAAEETITNSMQWSDLGARGALFNPDGNLTDVITAFLEPRIDLSGIAPRGVNPVVSDLPFEKGYFFYLNGRQVTKADMKERGVALLPGENVLTIRSELPRRSPNRFAIHEFFSAWHVLDAPFRVNGQLIHIFRKLPAAFQGYEVYVSIVNGAPSNIDHDVRVEVRLPALSKLLGGYKMRIPLHVGDRGKGAFAYGEVLVREWQGWQFWPASSQTLDIASPVEIIVKDSQLRLPFATIRLKKKIGMRFHVRLQSWDPDMAQSPAMLASRCTFSEVVTQPSPLKFDLLQLLRQAQARAETSGSHAEFDDTASLDVDLSPLFALGVTSEINRQLFEPRGVITEQLLQTLHGSLLSPEARLLPVAYRLLPRRQPNGGPEEPWLVIFLKLADRAHDYQMLSWPSAETPILPDGKEPADLFVIARNVPLSVLLRKDIVGGRWPVQVQDLTSRQEPGKRAAAIGEVRLWSKFSEMNVDVSPQPGDSDADGSDHVAQEPFKVLAREYARLLDHLRTRLLQSRKQMSVCLSGQSLGESIAWHEAIRQLHPKLGGNAILAVQHQSQSLSAALRTDADGLTLSLKGEAPLAGKKFAVVDPVITVKAMEAECDKAGYRLKGTLEIKAKARIEKSLIPLQAKCDCEMRTAHASLDRLTLKDLTMCLETAKGKTTVSSKSNITMEIDGRLQPADDATREAIATLMLEAVAVLSSSGDLDSLIDSIFKGK